MNPFEGENGEDFGDVKSSGMVLRLGEKNEENENENCDVS